MALILTQCQKPKQVQKNEKVNSEDVFFSKAYQKMENAERKIATEETLEFNYVNDTVKQSLVITNPKNGLINFFLKSDDLANRRSEGMYGQASLAKKSEIIVQKDGNKIEYDEFVDDNLCRTVIKIDKAKTSAVAQIQECIETHGEHEQCEDPPSFTSIAPMIRKR